MLPEEVPGRPPWDARVVGPPTDRPAYSEDGVDLTLIRWFRRLTPLERLQALQGAADSIVALRNARRVD
jgi:hypothetical protein